MQITIHRNTHKFLDGNAKNIESYFISIFRLIILRFKFLRLFRCDWVLYNFVLCVSFSRVHFGVWLVILSIHGYSWPSFYHHFETDKMYFMARNAINMLCRDRTANTNDSNELRPCSHFSLLFSPLAFSSFECDIFSNNIFHAILGFSLGHFSVTYTFSHYSSDGYSHFISLSLCINGSGLNFIYI